MIFSVHGPFALPRKGRRLLTSASDRRKFWSSVDAKVPGLSSACGCYVFTVRGQAWYVGLAEKQSFNPECYSSHKIVLFREALDAVMGPANLIFLAKRTLQDRFAKPTVGSYPAARMLENMLIGLATARNKRLLNIRIDEDIVG